MGAVGFFGGVGVELAEQAHDLDERMGARDVAGVAVGVVAFAVDVDGLGDGLGGFAHLVVDVAVVVGFVASLFHGG